jgi:hypothetical protein
MMSRCNTNGPRMGSDRTESAAAARLPRRDSRAPQLVHSRFLQRFHPRQGERGVAIHASGRPRARRGDAGYGRLAEKNRLHLGAIQGSDRRAHGPESS